MRPRPIQIFLALVALVAGGSIYVAGRSPSLLMFDWFRDLGAMGFVEYARYHAHHISENAPAFVLYSMPTGLWAFSFILMISAIWPNQSRDFNMYFYPIFVSVISIEFLQKSMVPGTFDINDVAANLGGFVFAMGVRNGCKKWALD